MKVGSLIDIGANLTHDSFDHDRDAVIRRALEAGVDRQIVTAATVEGARAAIRLAAAHPGVLYATAGVHPHHASGYSETAHAELRELLQEPSVVAVGECGLDYFRDYSPREAQRHAFRAQLELAVATGKPVFLHQRDAHADFLAMVAEFRPQLTRAVAHCFTDGVREAEDYLALGLAIGITGWICDERRGRHLREVVARIPAASLMIETDAPYLLPRNLPQQPRSRRNEPCFLPHIAAEIAASRGESFEQLAASTTAAAREFFSI
jgi:TatD DNase family protein